MAFGLMGLASSSLADADQALHQQDKAPVATEASVTTTTITVESGWVRASIPGAGNSVAFLTVRNHSGKDQAVVGVQCQVAKFCELHQHTHSGGKMRMEKVEQLQIPANSTLALSSGGYHIMLIELLEPLKPGSEVKLQLLLADQTAYSFSLPVRAVKDE